MAAVVVKLSKPLVLPAAGDAPERTIDEVKMDLDALTGADVDLCEREATVAAGELIQVRELHLGFHAQVASRASGLSVETLRKLASKDYLKVTRAVLNFFVEED